MATKRKVEVFTAGCPVCGEAVAMIERIACPSCDVEVLNLNEAGVAERAAAYGIRSVPAVVVDGEPASCCAGRGVSEEALRAAGVGTPL